MTFWNTLQKNWRHLSLQFLLPWGIALIFFAGRPGVPWSTADYIWFCVIGIVSSVGQVIWKITHHQKLCKRTREKVFAELAQIVVDPEWQEAEKRFIELKQEFPTIDFSDKQEEDKELLEFLRKSKAEYLTKVWSKNEPLIGWTDVQHNFWGSDARSVLQILAERLQKSGLEDRKNFRNDLIREKENYEKTKVMFVEHKNAIVSMTKGTRLHKVIVPMLAEYVGNFVRTCCNFENANTPEEVYRWGAEMRVLCNEFERWRQAINFLVTTKDLNGRTDERIQSVCMEHRFMWHLYQESYQE